MSQQILLPLDTFAQKHSSAITSQYSDPAKDGGRSHSLVISNSSYHNQDQSTSSSSGLGSGSESGASINGESETSDYQRSTPSPRDDPFQEQTLDNSKNKSKIPNPKDDLGFVEDLNNEETNLSVPVKSPVQPSQLSHNQKYQVTNTANNQSSPPKKERLKTGFSPKSFYKSTAKVLKLASL